VGNSLLRFDQPTMKRWRPAPAAYHPWIFARMRRTAWALAICFAAVTALSLKYAFTTPIVFSAISHDHDVFDCCGMAFSEEASLKPLIARVLNSISFGGWRILNTPARLRVAYLESLASPALFYSGCPP
jgi:hypothetical protein